MKKEPVFNEESQDEAQALSDPNKPIPVRFTPEQKAALRESATLDDRSVSGFIRACALKKMREMGTWEPLAQPGPKKT